MIRAGLPRRLVLAGAAALGGCSVLPERPYQVRRTWPLEARRPQTNVAPPGAPTLLVRTLRSGPGLESRGLRTRIAGGAETIDFWEEWTVPPPQAVEESLRQWLAASGLFAAVVQPGTDASADLILETDLLALVADLTTATATATLSFVLLRVEKSGQHSPILQRSLTGTAPLTGTDAPAQAAAMVQAVAAVLAQAETALAPFAARVGGRQ